MIRTQTRGEFIKMYVDRKLWGNNKEIKASVNPRSDNGSPRIRIKILKNKILNIESNNNRLKK